MSTVQYFYFFNHKDALKAICYVTFFINSFISWYSYVITNFEFKIFIIMLNTIVNIGTSLKNISRLCFDCSTKCVVVFVNYFTQLINVHIFDATIICL